MEGQPDPPHQLGGLGSAVSSPPGSSQGHGYQAFCCSFFSWHFKSFWPCWSQRTSTLACRIAVQTFLQHFEGGGLTHKPSPLHTALYRKQEWFLVSWKLFRLNFITVVDLHNIYESYNHDYYKLYLCYCCKMWSCISCQLASLSMFYFLCRVCVFFFLFFHKVTSLLGLFLFWQPTTWFMYLQLCALYFYTCWSQIKFSLSLSTRQNSTFAGVIAYVSAVFPRCSWRIRTLNRVVRAHCHSLS